MPRQVVAICRMPPSGVVTRGAQSYLERARALARRAEALGAQLVSWSATTLAFAWDPESVEEAVALAVSAREDALFAGSIWACGIAEGDMEPLSVAVQRADLAWGEPLVRAVGLARIADPGQVLLDDSLGAFERGELQTKGRRMGKDAGQEVHGEELDTRTPWSRAGIPSTSRFASEKAPKVMPALRDPSEEGTDPEVFAAQMVDLTRQALLAGN